MKKNQNKINIGTVILIVALTSVLIMWLTVSAIEIGEKLGNYNPSLRIVFDFCIAVVLICCVIYPIAGVFVTPSFSLERMRNLSGRARIKWRKRLVKTLNDNCDLTSDEKARVKSFITDTDSDDELIEFFDRKMTRLINREIRRTALGVLVTTAISQRSFFDMLSVLSANLMLIKRITGICGFRPSTSKVLSIYLKVLFNTFFAGALEEAPLEKLANLAVKKNAIVKAFSLAGPSLLQGVSSALGTFYIGSVTRRSILDADVRKTRWELRKKATAEAWDNLTSLMKNGLEEKVKEPVAGAFLRKKQIDVD